MLSDSTDTHISTPTMQLPSQIPKDYHREGHLGGISSRLATRHSLADGNIPAEGNVGTSDEPQRARTFNDECSILYPPDRHFSTSTSTSLVLESCNDSTTSSGRRQHVQNTALPNDSFSPLPGPRSIGESKTNHQNTCPLYERPRLTQSPYSSVKSKVVQDKGSVFMLSARSGDTVGTVDSGQCDDTTLKGDEGYDKARINTQNHNLYENVIDKCSMETREPLPTSSYGKELLSALEYSPRPESTSKSRNQELSHDIIDDSPMETRESHPTPSFRNGYLSTLEYTPKPESASRSRNQELSHDIIDDFPMETRASCPVSGFIPSQREYFCHPACSSVPNSTDDPNGESVKRVRDCTDENCRQTCTVSVPCQTEPHRCHQTTQCPTRSSTVKCGNCRHYYKTFGNDIQEVDGKHNCICERNRRHTQRCTSDRTMLGTHNTDPCANLRTYEKTSECSACYSPRVNECNHHNHYEITETKHRKQDQQIRNGQTEMYIHLPEGQREFSCRLSNGISTSCLAEKNDSSCQNDRRNWVLPRGLGRKTSACQTVNLCVAEKKDSTCQTGTEQSAVRHKVASCTSACQTADCRIAERKDLSCQTDKCAWAVHRPTERKTSASQTANFSIAERKNSSCQTVKEGLAVHEHVRRKTSACQTTSPSVPEQIAASCQTNRELWKRLQQIGRKSSFCQTEHSAMTERNESSCQTDNEQCATKPHRVDKKASACQTENRCEAVVEGACQTEDITTDRRPMRLADLMNSDEDKSLSPKQLFLSGSEEFIACETPVTEECVFQQSTRSSWDPASLEKSFSSLEAQVEHKEVDKSTVESADMSPVESADMSPMVEDLVVADLCSSDCCLRQYKEPALREERMRDIDSLMMRWKPASEASSEESGTDISQGDLAPEMQCSLDYNDPALKEDRMSKIDITFSKWKDRVIAVDAPNIHAMCTPGKETFLSDSNNDTRGSLSFREDQCLTSTPVCLERAKGNHTNNKSARRLDFRREEYKSQNCWGSPAAYVSLKKIQTRRACHICGRFGIHRYLAILETICRNCHQFSTTIVESIIYSLIFIIAILLMILSVRNFAPCRYRSAFMNHRHSVKTLVELIQQKLELRYAIRPPQ